MRAGLKTLLIIIAVIVVVTVAMTMTPLGWSLARSFIERQIVGDSDLALTIGSLRGNLLTHATLESITLTAPDVGVILSVDELALEYSLPALVGGRTVSSDISIADAHFLVEMGEDFVYHPHIAESLTISPDSLSITVAMKRWAWSDGTPLTSVDVVRSFDLFVDPLVASPRPGGRCSHGEKSARTMREWVLESPSTLKPPICQG